MVANTLTYVLYEIVKVNALVKNFLLTLYILNCYSTNKFYPPDFSIPFVMVEAYSYHLRQLSRLMNIETVKKTFHQTAEFIII
jgi:hypothetical protein